MIKDAHDPKSIAIVRLSALGDVLMIVPLVRTLQAQCPGATLTWIISRPAYDLVEGLDGVEFVVIDKPNNLLDYWRFRRQMRHRTFDVLLAAQASFRANLLYACIRAKRKIGYDKLRAKDGHGWFINESIAPGHDHTLDGFLKFADVLGVTQKHIRWDLPSLPSDEQWADAHLPNTQAPIVVINPAASKPERSWLIDRYIEVIHHLQTQHHAEVVLTGGPGDYDKQLGDAITSAVSVTNLIGKTKPKQLLAVIRKADLVLCPDTGPSHMAAAVGTPVIALHAVTSAHVSGPYPYRHLAVDCYPGSDVWGMHAHGADTMKLVEVKAVKAALDSVMVTLTPSHPLDQFQH